MIRRFVFGRGRVALQTAIVVPILLAARYGVEEAGWQFVTAGPLLTTVVTGGIFVVALVVAGTLTDYKESERVPAEMVAALRSILTDARAFKREKPAYDLAGMEQRIKSVIEAFKADVASPGSRTCLEAIDAISESFAEMDRLEVIATYISRLRGEQSALRKVVLRVYHIQETEFVPSAYTLIYAILIVAVGVLTFTKSEDATEGYVLLGAIYFFLIYLARLLKILDTPFQPRKQSADDVDFKLLNEFVARIDAVPENDGQAPASAGTPASSPPTSRPSWRGSRNRLRSSAQALRVSAGASVRHSSSGIGSSPAAVATWMHTWSAPASRWSCTRRAMAASSPHATSPSTRRSLPPSATSSSVNPKRRQLFT